MGIWDKLKGELIDIIDYMDTSNEVIVHRFERYGNEIKNGAQLTVRESQSALFVNEGKFADEFGPGRYELTTENLPILSTLMGWAHGFNSPFKAEVYFVSTREFSDLRWGTPNPMQVSSPDFPHGLQVRAFGSYQFHIRDAKTFLRQVSSTDNEYTKAEAEQYLRGLVLQHFPIAFSEAGYELRSISRHYGEVSKAICGLLQAEFEKYGIALTQFNIHSVTLPEELQKAMVQRASMDILGTDYGQMQTTEAMREAARNPSGGAGSGVGMGMGFGMAMQMAQQMGGQMANQGAGQAPQHAAGQSAAPAGPPPLPSAQAFYVGIDGQQKGPFASAELSQMAQAGQFNAETLVWQQGMDGWTKAGDVPALGGVLASVPPPLPG